MHHTFSEMEGTQNCRGLARGGEPEESGGERRTGSSSYSASPSKFTFHIGTSSITRFSFGLATWIVGAPPPPPGPPPPVFCLVMVFGFAIAGAGPIRSSDGSTRRALQLDTSTPSSTSSLDGIIRRSANEWLLDEIWVERGPKADGSGLMHGGVSASSVTSAEARSDDAHASQAAATTTHTRCCYGEPPRVSCRAVRPRSSPVGWPR